MPLTPQVDFVFFPKAHIVESRLKAKMIEACVIGTKRFLFLVPTVSYGSLFKTMVGAANVKKIRDPEADLRALLSQPDLTVQQLEQYMINALGRQEETRVFDLDRAELLKMKTGFMGQIKLKMPNDKLKLIALKGRGNKVVAKDFYAERQAA